MVVIYKRFDVFLVTLDPTIGHEIKKTRPAVIISPNEMNQSIKTVIIAPMTTKERMFPTRVPVHFKSKKGQIVLDQIRAVDKERLIKKLGVIKEIEGQKVLSILQEIFSDDDE